MTTFPYQDYDHDNDIQQYSVNVISILSLSPALLGWNHDRNQCAAFFFRKKHMRIHLDGGVPKLVYVHPKTPSAIRPVGVDFAMVPWGPWDCLWPCSDIHGVNSRRPNRSNLELGMFNFEWDYYHSMSVCQKNKQNQPWSMSNQMALYLKLHGPMDRRTEAPSWLVSSSCAPVGSARFVHPWWQKRPNLALKLAEMRVSINGGPQNRWFMREKPTNMDDDWG